MATVDAATVKKLREMTNAGIMDCKRALAESNGDFEKAKAWLREKLNVRADNKGDRETADGQVGVAISDDAKRGALIEINCETDFVARNDNFQNLVRNLATQAADGGMSDVQTFMQQALTSYDGRTVEEHVKESIGIVGENIVVTRLASLETTGVLGSYVHSDGKQAAIVELQADNIENREALENVARDVAMQAVALKAPYLSRDDVPADVVEKETEIFRKQAAEEGKPEAMLAKIAEGRLNKFYSENTLLGQAFVKDSTGKQSVTQYVKATLGDGVKVARFVRFKVGESQ